MAIGLFQALLQAQGATTAGWAMSRRAMLKAGLPPEWSDRVFAVTDGFRHAVEAMFREAKVDEAPQATDGTAPDDTTAKPESAAKSESTDPTRSRNRNRSSRCSR